jgi:excisionase family DNA binding protein
MMDTKCYAPDEIAEMLKVSQRTVYKWISDGLLDSLKAGRSIRVPRESLEKLIQHEHLSAEVPAGDEAITGLASQKLNLSLGMSAMTRREFLLSSASGIVSSFATLIASQLWRSMEAAGSMIYEKQSRAAEARDIFEELFGRLGPIRSYSLGKQTYPTGFSRSNLAAGIALIGPLNLLDSKPIVMPPNERIGIQPGGDLIAVGGPNSTPITMVAWEFDGPNDRQLVRRPDPLIPLRYYSLSDETDPTIAQDVRIGWFGEGFEPVSTVNWPVLDTWTGKRLRPQPGKRISIKTGDVHLPVDDYLIVTRIPNYLSSDFEGKLQLDPTVWPYMLVFDGSHGLATRAAELLVSDAGLDALRSARNMLGRASAYQLLFRVTKVELTEGGFHRYQTIQLEDAVCLEDKIDNTTYREANKYAMARIQRMSQTSS